MTLLLDTGPLVAAIDRSDHHHARCAALLESADGPLLVPTTVVEVCWLVEERPDIEAAFLDAIAAGEFEHVPLTTADLARMADLVRTYANLPLGAVDTSVIAVAERLKLTDVATPDRRHFTVVRPKHAKALNLLPKNAGAGRQMHKRRPSPRMPQVSGHAGQRAVSAMDPGSHRQHHAFATPSAQADEQTSERDLHAGTAAPVPADMGGMRCRVLGRAGRTDRSRSVRNC